MNTLQPHSAWPFDQEIFYHLDLVPYIDLKMEFDPRPMLDEALAMLDLFVEHRSYSQENKVSDGKWKSLGLRTFEGDPAKTEYHTSYTSEEKGVYKNTVLMEKCPETVKFLKQITDIEQCDRIRFMLLEPGTEIKTHSDSTRDVSFAINISLNMPEGCEFWSNLNPDGSLNEYSLKVPFEDRGSVLLFNNAKYHKLKNDSSVMRMHIIFHGPIKFSDEYILARAREQNKIFTRKEIIKNLVQKKAMMGESFAKTPAILKDMVNSGLSENSLGESVSLIVLKTTEDALEKITLPSIFPLKNDVVSDIDTHLKALDDKRYAVVCSAGTFVKSVHQFVLEVLKQIRKMKDSDAIVSGHIIDHAEGIPYFHQQFFILDLIAWRKMGAVKFGSFFGEEKIVFSSYERGKDIHDNYTPEFLRPGTSVLAREGFSHFGSKLMSTVLENSFSVLNLSEALRATKDYSYPLDENIQPKMRIQQEIEMRAAIAREDVYFFNNEELKIPQVKNLKPSQLVSVAAGFKAIKILSQYNYPDTAKVVFADFSSNALRYIKAVTAQKDFHSVLQQIEKFNKVLRPDSWSKGLNENLLRATLRDYFENDEKTFFHFLKMASSAHFCEMNFVLHPQKLVDTLSGEPFVIWVSNAFYNNHVYHLLRKPEADKSYHDLAKLIAKRMNVKAFAEKKSHNIVFGSSLSNLVGFLTDGCSQLISENSEDFIEL